MRTLSGEIAKNIGKEITIEGWVHKIRKLGGIAFVVVRDRKGLAQSVIEEPKSLKSVADVSTESVVAITGKVVKEDRAPNGAEIHATSVKIISKVTDELPVEINKNDMGINLDTLLDHRQITLRNLKQRAIFKIQAAVLQTFRDVLAAQDFTEISSPKIVEEGLETGGAEMFELKWFGKKAYLSQSPQMYKQIMVGVYERVFEISNYWRAEKHSTSRHTNEILMMDFEMGFIESWTEVMEMSESYIRALAANLKENLKPELEMFKVESPKIPKAIPRLKLSEAQAILEKDFGQKCLGEPDLDPTHEKQICEYALKEFGSDFIFITHYPTKKRPFYTFDDPENPKETLSFDLLYKGLEIMSGGQRLHRYEDYVAKLKSRGQNPADFEDYLKAFKFGMPPHGGTGWGPARIVARLLDLDNVREANLFPRDINRLKP